MDLRTFASALTMAEVNELSTILWDIKVHYVKTNLRPIPDFIKEVFKQEGFISAIKAYRSHYDASLLEAKLAVEQLRATSPLY